VSFTILPPISFCTISCSPKYGSSEKEGVPCLRITIKKAGSKNIPAKIKNLKILFLFIE
jgi:hypothetical protein